MTGGVQKRLKKFTMSFYKINYEQLRQSPEISEMLGALERGFNKFGIDFYLVGAVARDVWMNGIYNIKTGRTTKDIDFAVHRRPARLSPDPAGGSFWLTLPLFVLNLNVLIPQKGSEAI